MATQTSWSISLCFDKLPQRTSFHEHHRNYSHVSYRSWSIHCGSPPPAFLFNWCTLHVLLGLQCDFSSTWIMCNTQIGPVHPLKHLPCNNSSPKLDSRAPGDTLCAPPQTSQSTSFYHCFPTSVEKINSLHHWIIKWKHTLRPMEVQVLSRRNCTYEMALPRTPSDPALKEFNRKTAGP